jgi:hypothetical protein
VNASGLCVMTAQTLWPRLVVAKRTAGRALSLGREEPEICKNIEIPTASDFVDSGRSLLNLAWDAVSTLYLDLENADVKGCDDDGEVTDEFWKAAQRPLANAVAIAQQGPSTWW